jgi:PhzF family phenazine biosynthesis protein
MILGMKYPIYQIDAFTEVPFKGNPAAVVLMPAFPPDAALQAIAMENNLSETAFLVARAAHYELRWFTPEEEIDLCGHATLASAHAIFTILKPSTDRIRFVTRKSGELFVTRHANGSLEMDFPTWPSREVPFPEEICRAMAPLPPQPQSARNAGRDFILVYSSENEVASLVPDMKALENVPFTCIIATAPGSNRDFVSRVFCPRCSVPEDPVTGSAHCSLAPYWANRLNKQELRARQISPRGGELLCVLQGNRLLISGWACTYMQGEIKFDETAYKD